MSTTRRIYAGAAVTVAALVFLLAVLARVDPTSGPDAAVQIRSITPADGAVLPDPPTAVEIRISSRPDVDRSHIAVRGSGPNPLTTGPLAAAGDDGLRQGLAVPGPDDLVVAYHIVTVDGRDVSGITRFTVGPAGVRAAPAPPPPPHAHGVDPVGAALLIVDGLALLAVLVLLARRPARDPS